jgi:hypothetical protein
VPGSVPGYFSTQLLQRIDVLAAGVARGGYSSYRELATDGAIPLR